MSIPAEVDICAVLALIRPDADYSRCASYQELIDTWADVTAVPTEQEIIDAWPAALAVEDAKAVADIVREGAKAEFANIPNWATWDRATFNTWFDANVLTAADALPVLKRAIWGIIALRNDTWPDIQE